MTVFEFDNYRTFLKNWLHSQPKNGRGELARIAKSLDINPAIVTLVLKGKKDFTLEQAGDLAKYLGLSELETEYFMALVGSLRAGRTNLKEFYDRQIAKIRASSEKLKERIPAQSEMNEEAKSIFYSLWYYSGIRILTAVDEFQSINAIVSRTGLTATIVKSTLEFLVKYNLCIEANGMYKVGPQSTHIGADSPLANRHHINWRLKGIEKMHQMKSDELFFSSPVSISKNDLTKVRKILVRSLEDAFKIIDPSPSEEVACLNIDWFRY